VHSDIIPEQSGNERLHHKNMLLMLWLFCFTGFWPGVQESSQRTDCIVRTHHHVATDHRQHGANVEFSYLLLVR
jgi:hypothetical protein